MNGVVLTGGNDFNSNLLNVTFASGMIMSNVSVQVIGDNIIEELEEFTLTLYVPVLLGPAITAGHRDHAVGIINDSTSKDFNVIKR